MSQVGSKVISSTSDPSMVQQSWSSSFVSFAISCLETLSGLVLDKAQALSSQGNDSSHADKLLSDLSGVQGSWVDYAKTYST
jgi:hypothetical protein